MKLQAADDTEVLVEITLGVEILAEAGPDVRDRAQPLAFCRLQLFLAVDDLDVHIRPIADRQELLNPIVQPKIRTDEDDAFFCGLDDLLNDGS